MIITILLVFQKHDQLKEHVCVSDVPPNSGYNSVLINWWCITFSILNSPTNSDIFKLPIGTKLASYISVRFGYCVTKNYVVDCAVA